MERSFTREFGRHSIAAFRPNSSPWLFQWIQRQAGHRNRCEDPAVRGGQVPHQKVAEVGIETKRARIVVQNVAQQGQGKLPGPWGTGPPAESIERKCFEVGAGWKGRVPKLSEMEADDGIGPARDRASAVEDQAVRLGTKFRWSLDSAGVQHLHLPPTENPAQLSDVQVRFVLPSSATSPVAMLRADAASPLY